MNRIRSKKINWMPFLCAALALSAGGLPAAPARPAASPNIILLESDDHHPLALGCMGGPVRTPNIDALAARGALFRDNVCQGTMCAPSRNALVTWADPHAPKGQRITKKPAHILPLTDVRLVFKLNREQVKFHEAVTGQTIEAKPTDDGLEVRLPAFEILSVVVAEYCGDEVL